MNKKLRQIRTIIHTVYKTNRFYQKKLRSSGIHTEQQITSWKAFTSLPLTSRDEIEKDQAAHPPFGTNLTRPLSEYTYEISSSGTTTGNPFIQPLTLAEFKRYLQFVEYGDRLLGITDQDVFCHLTVSYFYPLSLAGVQRIGARMIPAESHKPIDMLKNLLRMNVTILQAYPTVLLELIELAKEVNIDLKKLHLKKIITCAEPGGEPGPMRDYLEKEWHTKITDHIGSTESFIYAIECPVTHEYHVLDKYFIVEVINPDTLEPTDEGELVLTMLWRFDFPLIRYRTGDLVKIDFSPCPCGNKSPRLIGGFRGRVGGLIKIRAGFIYPESVERLLRASSKILTYEIVCSKRLGLDMITIYFELSPDTEYTYLDLLDKQLVDLLGFSPRLYPLFPNTLPRFGFRKAKRFHDYRSKGRPPVHMLRIVFSHLFFYALVLNKWKHKLSKLFMVLTKYQ